ncbi:MAG: glycosyltransferase family 2 protein, partial [Paludibacteraceae bacterium]|nr:glycosyltransferase family 2 protein [Paludibacteraceae bacterium]
MKRCSVIILNWNGAKHLRNYLPSLVEHTMLPDVELVVADNGSTDESFDVLKLYPQIRLIRFDKNYGFAEGYNRAVREVDARYVVLLNSDVRLTAGWLSPLLNALEQDENIAACQPKIRADLHPENFEHAGAAGGFIDWWGYPYCRGRIMSYVEPDQGQYDSACDIFWATGACLCIRRDLYLSVGGLDSTFFAHMEEIDLCWRLRARGWRIRCIPQSTVYHLGGGTLSASNPQKTYLNFRNNLIMLYKNLPGKRLRQVMRTRWFMDNLAAFMMLLSGHAGDSKAIRKARHDYHQMRPDYNQARRENLQKMTNDSPAEMTRRS